MGICFIFGCGHRSDACGKKCSLFCFPLDAKRRAKWEKLCRRANTPLTSHHRICSCHFIDGKKQNGPTLFPWNKDKYFTYKDPECKSRKRRKIFSPFEIVRREKPDPAAAISSAVTLEHSYSYKCKESCLERIHALLDESTKLKATVQNLEDKVEKLAAMEIENNRMKALEAENKQLKKKIQNVEYKCEKLVTWGKTHSCMSIDHIKDSEDKMLLFTSFSYDIFVFLASSLKCLKLSYHCGWAVTSLSLENQLLITLMKLRLNYRDLDLAERFGVSSSTISNILHTFISALHELLFVGVQPQGVPSLAKCKGAMPRNFEITKSMPTSYKSISLKIAQLCDCLVNLQAALPKEVEQNLS